MSPFQITPLRGEQIAEMSRSASIAHGNPIERVHVDSQPGYPCRVSLEDVPVGEEVLLFSHSPFAGPGAYREVGPIFARMGAHSARLAANELPTAVRSRLVSVRAYNQREHMIDATIVEGAECAPQIRAFLADESVAFVHLRAAVTGCFLCRADRIEEGVASAHHEKLGAGAC